MISSILIGIAANLAHDLLKVGVSQLRDRDMTESEKEALRRAYEAGFLRMIETVTSDPPQQAEIHAVETLRYFVNDVRLSKHLLDLALTKYVLIRYEAPIDQLRQQFEEVGCDLDTFPIDFNDAVTGFLTGLADGLQAEEFNLHRFVGISLMKAVPARIAEQGKTLTEEERRTALRRYVAGLRAYCNELPYVLFSQKPLPSVLDVHVEQALEAVKQDLKHDRQSDIRSNPDGETLEYALQHHRHILLEGGPGLGKSCSLNYFCLKLLEECLRKGDGRLVPILVSARGLAARRCAFSEALSAEVTEQLGLRLGRPIGAELFAEPPVSGGIWLVIIDGLDEVINRQERTELVSAIKQQIEADSSLYRFIVSSRPVAIDNPFDSISIGRYLLKEFDLTQRASFVRRWFNNRPALKTKDTEAFLNQISDSTVAEVASVPLLLTISMLLYEQDSDRLILSRRVELYENFVRMLLEAQEAERAIRDSFIREWQKHYGQTGADCAENLFLCRRSLLEHVAYVRLSGSNKPLEENVADFIRSTGTLRQDIDEIWFHIQIRTLLARTGLVVTNGADATFSHHTFMEFLAASSVANKCKPDSKEAIEVVENWLSKGLHEPLMFLLGIWSEKGSNCTELLSRIWKSPNFLLAGRAMAEGIKVDPQLEDAVVSSVIKQALRLKDPKERFTKDQYPSLEILGMLRGRDTVRSTLSTLVRRDYFRNDIPAAAVDELGQLGSYDDLMTLAGDSEVNGFVRLHCASVLQRLGHQRDAESILLNLAKSQNVRVPRFHLYVEDRIPYLAARQLADLGRLPEAAEILHALALRTKCEVTREKTIDCLYALGCADELIALARDLPVAPDSKLNAAFELSRASHILLQNGRVAEARQILLQIVRDDGASDWCRLDALNSLNESGLESCEFRELITLAQSRQEDPLLRTEIAGVLIRKGVIDHTVLAEIGLDLRADGRIRFRAAQILGDVGQADEGLKVMISIINDPLCFSDSRYWFLPEPLKEIVGDSKESSLRFLAVDALKQFDRVTDLLNLVRNVGTDPLLRVRAGAACAELGQDVAGFLVEVVLNSTAPLDVQAESVSLLSRLAKESELVLIASDNTVDVRNRILAARAVADLGQVQFATSILLAISAADIPIKLRQLAAKSLGEFKQGDEIELLSRSLLDEEISVYVSAARDANLRKVIRRDAVAALGKMKEIETLRSLMADTSLNPDIRLDAAEWLRLLGLKIDVVPFLFAVAANDKDEDRYGFRNPFNALEDLKELCRETAITSNPPRGYDELLRLARDKERRWWIREEAARDLMSLGHVNAVAPTLQSTVLDSSEEMEFRRYSLDLLGRYRCSTELLQISCSRSVESEVRIKAIKHLRENGDHSGRSDLVIINNYLRRLAREDEDGRVRAAAHDALPRMTRLIKWKSRSQVTPSAA